MPVPGTNASGAYTETVGSGAVSCNPTVAGAGTAIGNATALLVGFTVVTAADDTVGVVLPASQPGKVVEIYSSVATCGLKVYPPVNSAINGGSANSAIVIEGKSLARFICTSASNWAGQYTANS